MKLGNELWEYTRFNSRLQPTEIGLGTTNSNSSFLGLQFDYGTTNNNGNVLTQTLNIIGTTPMTQNYTYDGVNRLKTATEGSTWSQTYDYDLCGNRAVIANAGIVLSPLTPTSLTAFNSGTNRIVGSGYDQAGNQTQDLTGRAFDYDAENRPVSYDGGLGTISYSYDGEGRRVKKVQGGVSTLFVYNVFGQLVAEYSDQEPSGSGGTSYLTADHLGSTRIVTDASRVLKARHDYLPFGERIPDSLGGRSAIPGYAASDSLRQKFTAKERDSESNLDYFGARYFSGAQGRWASADRINLTSARLLNPSGTLNKYSYAANNPLAYVDPDGEDITIFYRAPEQGNPVDFGHLFIAALNQASREVGFLDYYPNEPRVFAPGDVNRGDFSDRKGKYASLTIQTTPEVADKVLRFINEFKDKVPDYNLFTNSCVTACRAALEIAGVNALNLTPSGLWANLYARYSNEALNQSLANRLLGTLVLPKYTPSQQFGNPRNLGQGLDFQRFLFNLYLEQIRKPRKACVTVQGPNGPETSCEDY